MSASDPKPVEGEERPAPEPGTEEAGRRFEFTIWADVAGYESENDARRRVQNIIDGLDEDVVATIVDTKPWAGIEAVQATADEYMTKRGEEVDAAFADYLYSVHPLWRAIFRPDESSFYAGAEWQRINGIREQSHEPPAPEPVEAEERCVFEYRAGVACGQNATGMMHDPAIPHSLHHEFVPPTPPPTEETAGLDEARKWHRDSLRRQLEELARFGYSKERAEAVEHAAIDLMNAAVAESRAPLESRLERAEAALAEAWGWFDELRIVAKDYRHEIDGLEARAEARERQMAEALSEGREALSDLLSAAESLGEDDPPLAAFGALDAAITRLERALAATSQGGEGSERALSGRPQAQEEGKE